MHHKAHGERTIEKISHALDLIECVIESIKDFNFTFYDILTTLFGVDSQRTQIFDSPGPYSKSE